MIRKEIEKGLSVDDIVASDLLARWDRWGKGVISEREWIDCVYQQHLKETRQLKTSVCQPLTEAIVKGAIEEAVNLYPKLKQSHPDEYNFAENELNTLGYRLLERDQAELLSEEPE